MADDFRHSFGYAQRDPRDPHATYGIPLVRLVTRF